MPAPPSGQRTRRDMSAAATVSASSSSPSSADSIAAVAPLNDRRKTLLAIRDRLAAETDDTLWAQHKATCHCECGMGDGRLLVALVKELRAVEADIAALPDAEEVSDLDRLADELAAKRATRRTDAAG